VIYLSGKLKVHHIGQRADIGVMVGYRPNAGAGVGTIHLHKTKWAADNGCFKNPDLNVDHYLQWLSRLRKYQRTCLFATAPDVVGNAGATWSRSEPVLPQIRALGFPAALVAQDGFEHQAIRWCDFDVLFIGGTTEWKLSAGAFNVVLEAKRRGHLVHMGRVNSRRRLRIAKLAGCDSADGTLLVYRPDLYLERMQRWLDQLQQQPFLNY